MFENILTNIIADFIFLVITIIAGWSGFLILRRRKLLKFFGIKESKNISIYLSNLRITEHGSLGADGKPGLYKGTAVVFNEAVQAILLQSLFTYQIPVLNQQPGLLKYLLVADIRFNLQVAPLDETETDKNSTIITFGSPAYNIVSKWTEENIMLPIKFSIDSWSFYIDGVPTLKHLRQAFIQKIYDSKNNRVIFYIAGLMEIGTIGAINFLINNWRMLYKKYKQSPFSILVEIHEHNYKQSRIILEK